VKTTVRDIDVAGKRVLLRADFNVPLDEHGGITSDTRIRATLPTIRYLLQRRAAIIVCSHLGRPGGKRVDGLSLRVVAERLSRMLNRSVQMAEDCVGRHVEDLVRGLGGGQILMLENLRFHPGEKANDEEFAHALAGLAEVFVNDAFGACHRAHASIVGIPRYLPAAAGLLLEKELKTLGTLLGDPEHAFAGLFGGAKVSDKVGAIENILDKLDSLLVGGAMATLFMKARGYQTGRSETEAEALDTARALMKKTVGNGTKLLLPTDVVVAERIDPHADVETVPADQVPPDKHIVDIGPQTMQMYQEKLRGCRTVFWNGPLGVYEVPLLATGTKYMAHCLAGLPALTVVAGGSTADVVDDLKLADRMGFVSTGGGAAMEYLAGSTLPGVEALTEKEPAPRLLQVAASAAGR